MNHYVFERQPGPLRYVIPLEHERRPHWYMSVKNQNQQVSDAFIFKFYSIIHNMRTGISERKILFWTRKRQLNSDYIQFQD